MAFLVQRTNHQQLSRRDLAASEVPSCQMRLLLYRGTIIIGGVCAIAAVDSAFISYFG